MKNEIKRNKKIIWLGYLTYILIIISFFSFPAMGSLLELGIRLALPITILIIVVFLYPLILMLYFHFKKALTRKSGKILEVQVKLAASVSVSLGLLGTFQGLIQMVGRIAQALQGSGDISERIETLLLTIGSALNAMSYAFITSVLGVISSVVILISFNFFKYGFSQENLAEPSQEVLTLQNVESQLARLKDINLSIMDKIIAVGTDKAALNQLIDRVDTLIIKQEVVSQDIRSLVENTLTTNQTLLNSFEILNRAVDATSYVSNGVDKLTHEISHLITAVNNHIAQTNENNSIIASKFSSLQHELSNLGIIESHLGEIKAINRHQIESINNLATEVNDFSSELTSGLSSLPAIENSVTGLASRVHDYSNQLTNLDVSINNLNQHSVLASKSQQELLEINKHLIAVVQEGNSATSGFIQQQLAITQQQATEQEAYKIKVKTALEALI